MVAQEIMVKKEMKLKLSLYEPVRYQIKVPGELDAFWSNWAGEITAVIGVAEDGSPVTTLTGMFDQAALHGFLRHLYAVGLPLISVAWMDGDRGTKAAGESPSLP
jgi:hypothetical protein